MVEFAGPLRGQGLVAVLRLAGGWRVVLSGLGRITAPAGANGARGRTPRATPAPGAPEVGLQLRRGAEAVDPGPAAGDGTLGDARPHRSAPRSTSAASAAATPVS